MRIIDFHCHLDDRIEGPPENAARELNQQLETSGIELGVVLQLSHQRWSYQEVAAAIANHRRLIGFVSVHPYDVAPIATLVDAVTNHGYRGLKLHPRLQGIQPNSKKTVELVRKAGELGIPVLICGFPDGEWLMDARSAGEYGDLCRMASDTKIVVAHMGGHKVLDFLMLCKRLPNMYLDTSFSLLYYRGSGVELDLVYALKSLRYKRVMYGSDYPDRPIAASLSGTREVLSRATINAEDSDLLFFQNAQELLNYTR